MKTRFLQLLLLLIALAAISYGGYSALYYPYYVLPRQDQAFLASHPNREAVLQRFGRPAEELQSGAHFPMTGWYPLPDRPVSHSALSFVRRYGKLYMYFDSRGDMEHFVISRS